MSNNDVNSLLTVVFIGLPVLLIVLVISKKFWCWLFRINEQIALLTEIRNSLKKE
jgi:hypothetical protein